MKEGFVFNLVYLFAVLLLYSSLVYAEKEIQNRMILLKIRKFKSDSSFKFATFMCYFFLVSIIIDLTFYSEEANGVTQMDDEVKGSWADAAEQSEQQET